MILRLSLAACLSLGLCAQPCGAQQPAQNMAQQVAPRLPTVREARERASPSIQLEVYKLGKLALECDLPDGNLVEITPVADRSDFTFMAIKSKTGRLIIANEKVLPTTELQYAAFSFYRECAMHIVTDVRSKGPDQNDVYPMSTVRTAECLAVLPTKRAIAPAASLALYRIASQLENEYGTGVSSQSDLRRCESADYVRKQVEACRRVADCRGK